MKYKLSSGETGTTNLSKEEFQKVIIKNISIIIWEKENAILGLHDE